MAFLWPIFPFDNRDFPAGETHNSTIRLENDDDEWTSDCGRQYKSKLEANSFLRLDNAFRIAKCIIKPVIGDNGGCLRVPEAGLAACLAFLAKEEILEGCKANPMWKANIWKAKQLSQTAPVKKNIDTGASRGGARGGDQGGRGGGKGGHRRKFKHRVEKNHGGGPGQHTHRGGNSSYRPDGFHRPYGNGLPSGGSFMPQHDPPKISPPYPNVGGYPPQ